MTRPQIINLTLLILWLGVIFLLSNEPSSVSSGRSGAIVQALQSFDPSLINAHDVSFYVRKAAHITAYFIVGILMFRVIRTHKFVSLKAVIVSIGLVALYATSDELHQLLVNGRSAEVRDVLIDTTAGALGAVATYLVVRRYGSKKVR